MDGISFIIKRFFYSFLSGCIIIFYGIIYYYILKETSTFPSYFNLIIDIIKNYNNKYPLLVFVIVAIFLSIIIEGICQVGLERYLLLYDKEKKFNGKKLKDFKTSKEKYEYFKYKKEKKILEFIFINQSILWVCKFFKEEDFNYMKTFIEDSGLKEELCKYFNCNLNYNALYICARVIEREKKINNIYHYRDNSYIIQMLRLSFWGITLTTFFSGIVFYFLKYIKLWEFKTIGNCEPFFIFISCILLISLIIFFVLREISISFAKRFVREVGYTYEAMKLDLPINKNVDSFNERLQS